MSDELREETGYALTLFQTNCSPLHSLLITYCCQPPPNALYSWTSDSNSFRLV